MKNFIENYLKAHAAIWVPIYTIEYIMCILSCADCKMGNENKQMFNIFSRYTDIDA